MWIYIFETGQEKIADIPNDFLDMSRGCIKEMRRQIQAEIDASIQYMAMGAHFAKDTINRPGFSEFFFKSAGEEREHAGKLIEYLLMRGQLTDDVSNLIQVNVSVCTAYLLFLSTLHDFKYQSLYIFYYQQHFYLSIFHCLNNHNLLLLIVLKFIVCFYFCFRFHKNYHGKQPSKL